MLRNTLFSALFRSSALFRGVRARVISQEEATKRVTDHPGPCSAFMCQDDLKALQKICQCVSQQSKFPSFRGVSI